MEKKARILVGIVAAAFLICVIFPGYGAVVRGNTGQFEGIHPFREGWNLVEGGVWREISLPFRRSVPAGEEITFARRITQEEWGKWVYVPTSNKLFRAYADDRLIYSRETFATPKNESAPTSGFNYIEIPQGTEELFFVLSSPYFGGGGELSSVYIGDSEAHLVYLNYVLYEFNRFMATLLLFFGGFGVVYGLFLFFRQERADIMVSLGILALTLGTWLTYGTMNIENRHLSFVAGELIAYAAWFLIPVTLCGFMGCYFRSRKKKYFCMAAGFGLNLAAAFGLAFAGCLELVETALVTALFLIAVLLVIFYDVVTGLRQGGMRDRRVGAAGFGLLCVLAVVELMVFYFSTMPSGAFLHIGIVCCVMFLGAEELYRSEREKLRMFRGLAESRQKQQLITLSQLQSKFTFDALDAVRQMIRTDSDSAYDMLRDFTCFLRANYRGMREQMIPFSQELEQVRAYLGIEEKRFKQKIRAEYEIETEAFEIPALTVEPLVRSAVRRGLRSGRDTATVTVRVCRKDGAIVIEVADDGMGYDINMVSDGQMESGALGDWDDPDFGADSCLSLSGVCDRLKQLTDASVWVESEPGRGTNIRVEIREKD